MIPILYGGGETAFTSNGLGPIRDALSCVVDEELNGAYTLKLSVPPTTARLADLKAGNIILARANPYDQLQPFRIQRVSKRLRGELEIHAPHISYDMARTVFDPSSYPYQPANLGAAITAINAAANQTPRKFTFSTTMPSPEIIDMHMKLEAPVYLWDLLKAEDNGLGQLGDWSFDRWSVTLATRRGADRGYEIVYGRNMTGLTVETDGEEMYTAYLPVWSGSGSVRVGTLYDPKPSVYPFSRVLLADCSEDFNSRPSVASLDSAAEARYKPGINAMQVQTKIGIVPPGSRGLKTLEDVRLGDTVKVIHEGMDIQIQARVVKTSYDVLAEKTRTLDVEGRLTGAADTIARIAAGKRRAV